MIARMSTVLAGSWSRLALVTLMAAVTVLSGRLCASGDEASVEPSAIRRVVLPADQVLGQMERVQQGSLVLLDRADFEARVRHAEAALDAAGKPPRLVEAHYHARAGGPALVDGTADWRIANPSHTAAVLPIASLNLAITRARVENGSKTGLTVVLGEINGTNLGLLVRADPEQRVHLEWSARGDARSGDWHFALQVPPCPVATLDLDLPADRSLMPGEQFLVSGPSPTDTPGYRRWQIAFSGRSALELVVQPESATQGTRLPTLARLRTTQTLEPDLLTADFDFNLEVPRRPLESLAFVCDPSLHATDVRGADVASWETDGTAADQSEDLLVRFRQPFRGGVIHIHCLAALRTGQTWTSPTIHLSNGVVRGESLTLRVQRDVILDRWQPGAFRFIRPAVVDQASAPVGWQVLSLLREDLGSDKGLSRPRADLRVGSSELRLRQWSWWQVGMDNSALTVQVAAEVAQGRRFRLTFAVPAGWRVTDVGASDRVRRWSTVLNHGRPELAIDFFQPLSPGTVTRALIHMRPSRTGSSPGGQLSERSDAVHLVPFPDLVPQQACFREGTLAIRVDPNSEAEAECRQPAETAWSSDVEAAWGKQPPNYSYRFRDLLLGPGAPPGLTGVLRIRPREARFGARCTERVLFPSGRAALAVELELRPLAGSPSSFNFFLSSPMTPSSGSRRPFLDQVAGTVALSPTSPVAALAVALQQAPVPTWPWQVKGGKQTVQAQLDRATRIASSLHALAGPTALNATVAYAAIPQGECWRLLLPNPLTRPVVLQSTLEMGEKPIEDPIRGHIGEWTVPLIFIPNASTMEGTVLLDSARLLDRHVLFAGRHTGDTLRYSAWPAQLTVSGRPERHSPPGGETIDRADLTTWAQPDGNVLEQLRFHVRNWRRQRLPVKLPEDARLRAGLVDGHWMVMMTPSPASSVVSLPMPGDAGWHTVELVYDRPQQCGRICRALPIGLPELPIAPLDFRHTWRLPPDVVPLFQNHFDRLPGWGDDSAGIPELAHTLEAPWLGAGENTAARQALSRDVQSLWRSEPAPGQRWRLGALLDRAVFHDNPRGLPPILVDGYALAQEALSSETELPRAPVGSIAGTVWSDLGLSLLAGRSGLLLTTQRQVNDWLARGTRERPLPGSIEDALAEATQYGQDRRGRFQTLADWLGSSRAMPIASESAPPLAPTNRAKPLGLDGPWTAWELKPGQPEGRSLVLVRAGAIRGMGMAVACLLFGVWCLLRRFRRRARVLPQLVWLGSAGLALLWLPESLRALAWWPGLIAVVLAAGSWAHSLVMTRSAGLAMPVAVLLSLLAAGLFLQAAPTEAVTVFLLPGDGPGRPAQVLAPPDLLDRMQSIANRGPAGLHRAVLLGSRYQGTAESAALLRGEFKVYCFGDQPVSLVLPLSGVQIGDARLDGAPVSLTALRSPREGYGLRVKGTGVHKLAIDFRAAIAVDGDARDLKFSVPDLPESHLELKVPSGAQHVQALGARGAQSVDNANGSVQLQAELGRIAAIHVRWRQASGKAIPVVHVREAYLWNLRPSGTSLVGVLRFTVSKGSVPALTVELPADMQVRGVEVDRLPDDDGNELPPRSRDWAVSEADRRLHVTFQEPLVHGAQLTLSLVPAHGLGWTPRLTVPTPVDAGPSPEAGAEPLLAYHVEGYTARLTDNLRVTRQDDRSAFLELWREAGQPDPGADVNVFSFPRVPGAAPYLQLATSSPLAIESCVQTTVWQVGATRADFTATIDVKAPMHDLVVVECQVGPIVVAEVSSNGVRSWSQTGEVVQVWLQHAVAQASLRLTGWVPRVPPGNAQFHFAAIGVCSVKTSTGTVDVLTYDGLETEAMELRHLQPLKEPQPSLRRRRYAIQQADYSGVFRVRRAQPEGRVQTLTAAELKEGKVTVDVTIRGQSSADPELLTIHLWRAEGAEAHFDKGPFSIREAPEAASDGRAWTVMVPAATSQQLHLRIALPADPSSELLMPLVTVDGAASVESWVAVIGPELRADGAVHLAEVSNPSASLKRWPGWPARFRRGGHVWRVAQPGWRLRLRPHLTVAGPSSVRLFLCDQTARLVNGVRWIHDASCLVYHETDTDLQVQLPRGAHAIEVSVDERSIPAVELESDVVHVNLAGHQGVRRVRLQWQFDTRDESLERPNLERPRFRDVTDGPSLWTVYLPGNYSVYDEPGSSQAAKSTSADADLSRAAAELELSGVLAQGLSLNAELFSRRLLASQERFAWYCRQASRHLHASGDPGIPVQRLRERDRRLAEAEGFQRLRLEAEANLDRVATAAAPAGAVDGYAWPGVQGMPQRWTGPSEAAAPALQLVPRSVEQRQRALAYSCLLIIALAGIGIVSQAKRRLGEQAR